MNQLSILPEAQARTGRPHSRVPSEAVFTPSEISGQASKPRILFVGEGVTLAHVVRPLQLASNLKARGYDVVFACDPRYRRLAEEKKLAFEPLDSISPKLFLERVYHARPLFRLDEIKTYVRDDVALVTRTAPDVVVGDFRLSLGISAELCKLPHVAFSNAHWSPNAQLRCPVPEHPLVNVLGVAVMRQILRLSLPMFFAIQAHAFNRLRKAYGLKPYRGRGAHEVFTHGTRTLYLDIPQLYNFEHLSDSEAFIGPVNWEPEIPLPDWWARLPTDRPTVFITPGSSGSPQATQRLIHALAQTDCTLIVATAGRMPADGFPENVFIADFVPGLKAAGRSDLVICNGGSAMVYQALTMGTPVLGVPFNTDQYYMMELLEKQGAGKWIRSGRVNPEIVKSQVGEMLAQSSFGAAARICRRNIEALNCTEAFLRELDVLRLNGKPKA